MNTLIDWFIPAASMRGRTDWELARIFVFTHLFGPLIAQPMSVQLYFASPEISYPLVVMALGICSFWALPFVLRWIGRLKLAALLSFQLLASTSLFGSYHYGGFSSPFLPWLIVSMLLGLFYLSRNTGTVLALFAANVTAFLGVIAVWGIPQRIALEDLRLLGWLSIGSATIYMAWMALYYSRVIRMRTELEVEAERYQAISLELERAREVAEETGQARSRFFSKMSHELRTPLNAIIGYSEILLEDCQSDPGSSESRSQDVGRINAAGKHLLSLLSEVLDSDKLEADVARVDIASFSLGSLCDEVVANALPMVEKNGNSLTVICPRRDYLLTTDGKKLRQMLINLLSNAGKFTKNGSVRLEFQIEATQGEDQMMAIVSDTGIGIPSEALPRLFKDYEQADASTFGSFGGTGLGLALSRKLSILLGGEILVTSRPGAGSTFTIAIPAHLDEREPAAPSRHADRPTLSGAPA